MLLGAVFLLPSTFGLKFQRSKPCPQATGNSCTAQDGQSCREGCGMAWLSGGSSLVERPALAHLSPN